MSTAEEREEGIERLLHEGRVHRWARSRPAWPGHTTFVALKGGEVEIGDRYAAEGIVRTYRCDQASLLEGTFQELVAAQLGARVLAELLGEVRRELGDAAPKPVEAKPAPPAPPPKPVEAKPVEAKPAPPAPPPKPVEAKPVEAKPVEAKPAASEKSRVDVAVVACRSIGLPLVVALRGLTRSPVKDLLPRLQALPCRVATGLTREQAENVAARLAGLEADVELLSEGS